MDIIISEKAIAGERIASLLADGKVSVRSVSGAKVFEFEWKGSPVRLIPLRGHISDVEFPVQYSNWIGTDVRKLIDAEIIYSPTERDIINCIKDSALESERIIVATDADREGEAIGLEALVYAKETNKNIKVERAYFSAIIKEDIEKSFSSLEKFDYNFAYSANARREIDLIWGAVLTRFLSLISGQLGKEFLSVGRVQTPTLALIVDREKERLAFESKKYWEIAAHCDKNKEKFLALHSEGKFWNEKKAKEVFAKNPKSAVVKKIEKKRRTLKKPVPFNTTEFLRAATAIGFSASKAMSLAETLYQRGFTSYPRTDNCVYPKNLDLREILNRLVSVRELERDVTKILGKKTLNPSAGKETKDHPPVHPVSAVQKEMLNNDEWKIYELIAKRFLATLADDAETENVTVLLDAEGEPYAARGQIIISAGWKAFYPYSKLSEIILPRLDVDDNVKIEKLDLFEKCTEPPARYSQGSLIKLMEENNLGTKSTRPAIIQKLYSRRYIVGGTSLEPSKVAFSVIDSLEKHCVLVTKPEMTANVEKEMDEIAAGKKTREEVVANSGKYLHGVMEVLFKEKDSIGGELRSALRFSSVVGKCGKCGNGQLVIRHGKSGKRFVGCSEYPRCNNSFPLPQKGAITLTSDSCPECGAPIVKIRNIRFSYKMCLTMTCVTKNDWGKKKEQKEKVEEKSSAAPEKTKVIEKPKPAKKARAKKSSSKKAKIISEEILNEIEENEEIDSANSQ
ncbi:MAG: DNA topoisomerase I [Candidatus Diapherotrites archaeon]|nr:DNA topoisomerase I [Candidatus Diapherotrites archaeon]